MTVQVTREGYVASLTISGSTARGPVLEAMAGVEPAAILAVLVNAAPSADLESWTGD